MSDIIKEIVKKREIQKLYKEKNKKGWFFNRNPEITDVTSEEKRNIEK